MRGRREHLCREAQRQTVPASCPASRRAHGADAMSTACYSRICAPMQIDVCRMSFPVVLEDMEKVIVNASYLIRQFVIFTPPPTARLKPKPVPDATACIQ